MDISEQCGYSIQEQINLFESIRPLFSNKPVIVALNKIDLVRRDQLSPENGELLAKLETGGVPMYQMSTVSTEGIMDLRNKVRVSNYYFSMCLSSHAIC